MRARLKVCCIASVEEARLAAKYGASALGLVARMPSGPGPIDDDLIRDIARSVPPGIATFLLTCETEVDAVVAHVLRCGTNTVQLVDEVDSKAYTALRRAAPAVKIVQVIHVQDGNALDEAHAAAAHVDAILLDSGRPRGLAPGAVKELGGTGRTHDWSVSRGIVESLNKPVFLAGGINPANVAEAISSVAPWGIDLCTGVRTNGKLDEGKLASLTAAMR